MDEETNGSLDSTIHLLLRARSGDQAAIEQLFVRHREPLRRWARGRLPQWARQLSDTDDLVQDALLQTFKRIEDFDPRGPGALQAYLRQVVFNRVRDELRRRGRVPPSIDLNSAAEAGDLMIDGRDSPLDQAIGRENLQHYQEALARLEPDQREAIVGRIERGYTYLELAEVMGKPTAEAARKATQRAVIRLAEEMRRARN